MKTDEGYLLDMLLAAREACEFVRGMDRAAFGTAGCIRTRS